MKEQFVLKFVGRTSLIMIAALVALRGSDSGQELNYIPQVTQNRSDEKVGNSQTNLQETLSDEAKIERFKVNLTKTLEWMKSYPNPEVQIIGDAFNLFKSEFDQGDRTHVDVIESGSLSLKYSGVTLYPSTKGRSLRITFSVSRFIAEDFSPQEAAASLAESWYAYQLALGNPNRYATDFQFRSQVEVQANQRVLGLFSFEQ